MTINDVVLTLIILVTLIGTSIGIVAVSGCIGAYGVFMAHTPEMSESQSLAVMKSVRRFAIAILTLWIVAYSLILLAAIQLIERMAQ